MAFSVADIAEAKAFRISPKDTNYFVMLFDKETDKIDNIFVIEIFKAGGATPPNEHASGARILPCAARRGRRPL